MSFLPGLFDSQENLLPKDGVLTYEPRFYEEEEAQELFERLRIGVAWKQDKMKMYGKELELPRLTAWYGDEGLSYTYSGITNHPTAWSEELLLIKKKIEAHCGERFNSLLLNYYRGGGDHVSFHADDEPALGRNPVIASLSLGANRRFQLKHKTDKGLELVNLELENGSLLMMKDKLQHHWLHRLVPTKKAVGPRINLTFRTIQI